MITFKRLTSTVAYILLKTLHSVIRRRSFMLYAISFLEMRTMLFGGNYFETSGISEMTGKKHHPRAAIEAEN